MQGLTLRQLRPASRLLRLVFFRGKKEPYRVIRNPSDPGGTPPYPRQDRRRG
jgi:hypothetical protein